MSAPAGQASTHLGLPSHRLHLVALQVSSSNETICQGQAPRQIRQPVHLSGSTVRALVEGDKTMAFSGQALAQGTGWRHCLQIPVRQGRLPSRPFRHARPKHHLARSSGFVRS